MWRVVNGEAFWSCKWSARTQMSCIAVMDHLDAKCWSQLTEGLLSLYWAICVWVRYGTTALMRSHTKTRPVHLRLQLVTVPVGFASKMSEH